jgi:capsular exopolysaccharide synthesis family protein
MKSGMPEHPERLHASGGELRRFEDNRRMARSTAPALVRSSRATPPALQSSVTVQGLLLGLKRYWLSAVGLGLLLGTMAAVAAWFVIPASKYSAESLLLVASRAPRVLSSNVQFETPDQFRNYQVAQETYLRSRLVLGEALRKPEVAKLPAILASPDPIEWLSKEIQISFKGEILRIGMEGDQPQELMALVNAVTGAYMSEVVNVEQNRRRIQYNTLDKVYVDYQENLRQRKATLRGMAEQTGTSSQETLAFKQQLQLERLSTVHRNLDSVRTQLREAQTELSVLGSGSAAAGSQAGAVASASAPGLDSGTAAIPGLGSPAAAAPETPPIDMRAIEAAVRRDPETRQLEDELATLKQTQARYRGLLRGSGSSDPAIKRVTNEIQTAQQALDGHKQALRRQLVAQEQASQAGRAPLSSVSGASMSAASRVAENAEKRVFLGRRIELLTQYEKELVTEASRLEKDTFLLNTKGLELEQAQEEIERDEQVALRIGREVDNLKVELDAPARVTLIEDAKVARPISAKKKLMATGVAGLGMLGLTLTGFAWWGARMRRVNHVDDVVQGLGMKLVGVLPALPSGGGSKQAGRWEHLLMESVDATRAMLLHGSRTEQLRVLMVTSAVKGEGKTSLACHLATSLARGRQRTLLIDADLRSPLVHTLFDLPQVPGVCEYLRGDVALSDLIQASSAPGLSLIAAGRCDAAALAGLAEGKLQGLIDAVRNQYDFVIVDSAPVLPVADSLQVSQHVDGVVFSVLRDVSQLPQIYKAYERLDDLGVRLLGAVVAGTRAPKAYGYGYGTYGYQGDTEADDTAAPLDEPKTVSS